MSAHNTNVADVAEALDAGWRPDPTGRYEWRYWDGGWTNRVASSRPSTAEPAAAPTAPRASTPPAAPQATADPAPAPAPATPPASTDAPAAAVLSSEPAPNAATAVAAYAAESAADAAPISVPWGTTGEAAPEAPGRESKGRFLVRAWAATSAFFRSFVNEPESYHSNRAVDIAPDPRGNKMIVASPANYGRAGLVALSACGVAIGSYLPWLSGTIDGIPFKQTGFEDGHGWAFTIGAFALVCAALLAVRLPLLRWVAVLIAVALAGLTFRDLVHAHDVVTTMNTSATIEADVGTGLWIMAGCSVVALIASFRLGERD